MDRALTHEEANALLGAYALDAVEPDEADAVARHLAECPRCAAEVAEHHEVIGMFANAGADAPPEVWDRIAARIGATPPAQPRPAPRRAATGPGAPVLRPLWRRRWVWPAAAAVGAAAAVMALLAVQVGHLDGRVGQLAAAGQKNGLQQAVTAALANPAARRVTLSAAPAAGSSGAAAQAAVLVILPDGSAFAVNTGMPALVGGRTYQLWAVAGGRPVSLGLLGSHPNDVAFTVSPSAPVTSFAVTAEPAGGTAQPTSPPVAQSATLST